MWADINEMRGWDGGLARGGWLAGDEGVVCELGEGWVGFGFWGGA